MNTQTQNSSTLVTWNLKLDICFLQETHFANTDLNHLQSKDFTNIYSSTLNSRRRGVSILIHDRLLYKHLGNLSNHMTIINIQWCAKILEQLSNLKKLVVYFFPRILITSHIQLGLVLDNPVTLY
uniref:Endonuclease/exonuclease/phosphatase domain-containing protein n=1 Tax=Sphaeramia orbicularis TaxID=375764 RepID=A0A673BN77_9TELE